LFICLFICLFYSIVYYFLLSIKIIIQDYVHGVNVKLEKAGGIRGALLAADKALELGLKVWIGVMVGSCLNSNAAGKLDGLVII
jgi:L-alanine-DL-glutamate epimerase-like enolase superfamily enzyme